LANFNAHFWLLTVSVLEMLQGYYGCTIVTDLLRLKTPYVSI